MNARGLKYFYGRTWALNSFSNGFESIKKISELFLFKKYLINQSTFLNNAAQGQNDETSNGSLIIRSLTDGRNFEKNHFFPDNELSEEIVSNENFKTQTN